MRMNRDSLLHYECRNLLFEEHDFCVTRTVEEEKNVKKKKITKLN